jgi:hypothetical protein
VRGGPDRATDRDGTHASSCELETALCRRSEIATRLGDPAAEDGPSAEDAHRQELFALRKQTPEPVFGIIKSVMGYRQCLLRGLQSVKGEWNLVSMSWNIKRMFALQTG